MLAVLMIICSQNLGNRQSWPCAMFIYNSRREWSDSSMWWRCKINESALLDNPCWHALNSHHRHLAIRGKIAVRYPADVLFGAAMPAYDAAGFDDLRDIVDEEEVIGLILEALPDPLPGWDVLARGKTPFLHHAPSNDGAARLYRKLGFRKRRELSVAVLKQSAIA